MKKQILLILYVCSAYLLSSCTAGDDSGQLNPSIDHIESILSRGRLLLDAEERNQTLFLYFESDTVSLSADAYIDCTVQKEKWTTMLRLFDNHTLQIPTLGTSLGIKSENIAVNVSGYAPLSAQVDLSLPIEGRVKVGINGRTDTLCSVTHLSDKYGYNHVVDIHGMYPDALNKVYISLTDKDGNIRLTDSINIQTQSIESILLPKIAITTCNKQQLDGHFIFVNYLGESEVDPVCPFVMDSDGSIRWLLSLKQHPKLGNLNGGCGFHRLRNGNFVCGDVISGMIFEINLWGEVVNEWSLRSKGYEFHHEIIEIPSGNFIITVSKTSSYHLSGVATIEDVIVEIDRQTGNVVREWDLKESLDEYRNLLKSPAIPGYNDWAHCNAVLYDEKDNTLIVSSRFQGLVKLTMDNSPVWIASPHKGWGQNRKGMSLAGNLLNPIAEDGRAITDAAVLQGDANMSGFDWSWGGHNPVLLSDGSILMFDNGFSRCYKDDSPYSRAVIYKVDETNKTIRQQWSYGKQRGEETYAWAVSGVQYLPRTDHVLFCPGIDTPNSNGVGGKIIEIDRATHQVCFEAHLSTYCKIAFHRAFKQSIYNN
ncbi:MAG: aryl-sulfate sulfotransferase [Tannerellaceae bacterium]